MSLFLSPLNIGYLPQITAYTDGSLPSDRTGAGVSFKIYRHEYLVISGTWRGAEELKIGKPCLK
jgi:hypothetical protein